MGVYAVAVDIGLISTILEVCVHAHVRAHKQMKELGLKVCDNEVPFTTAIKILHFLFVYF